MEWTVRIEDVEYKAPSLEALKDWYIQKRIRSDSYVYHPILQKWMYAKDLEELRVGQPPSESWSPGVAAVLSLVIPGAGQMYKGSIAAGLLWLLFVVLGYVCLIVPGLILHLLCIVNAANAKT